MIFAQGLCGRTSQAHAPRSLSRAQPIAGRPRSGGAAHDLRAEEMRGLRGNLRANGRQPEILSRVSIEAREPPIAFPPADPHQSQATAATRQTPPIKRHETARRSPLRRTKRMERI